MLYLSKNSYLRIFVNPGPGTWIMRARCSSIFPTTFKDCVSIIFTSCSHLGTDRQDAGKFWFSLISENVGVKSLYLMGDIDWWFKCTLSWYGLELTFDLVVVSPTIKIFSRL